MVNNENRPDPDQCDPHWTNQELLDGGHAIREVDSGANPDIIEDFFPEPNIPQDPGMGTGTRDACEAFFHQPRRSGK